MLTRNEIDLLSVTVQALGFVGIIWGLWQNRRTLQTQVALEFFRRYEALTATMPVKLRLPEFESLSLASVPPDERQQIQVAVIQYLNLSSEEHLLFERGRIARDIWAIAGAEIRQNFRKPLWQDIWRTVRSEYASAPNFLAFIDRTIEVQ